MQFLRSGQRKIKGFTFFSHPSFLRMASIATAVMVFQHCSSGKDQKKIATVTLTDSVVAVKENFQTGQIIDKIECKNDPTQSFSLYLPSTYSSDKQYPIVYAFDPHATGKLPVSLYKDLAEQYGYILVGSNNSKNGTRWEDSQVIAGTLFADAGSRLSVNIHRVYVLGFSGGARVANSLAITNGAIEGVICCGAAAPAVNPASPRNNYTFCGIAGNEDFNFVEMRKYDMVDLAGHNVKHALLTFDGKHEWPPKDLMNEAFWWLELNDMRKNTATKNDSLIAQHIQPIQKQLDAYKKKKQVFEIYSLCRKTINFYDGLTDLSAFYEQYKAVQENPEIDKQLKHDEEKWAEEDALKQKYINAFQTQSLQWWNQEIASLNQKIKSDKDKSKVLVYKRTLGFMSLAAYMQTTGALKQNVLQAADFYSKLYVLVDPTNNEAHYLTASVDALKGDNKAALKSMKEAIKNGFKDTLRLKEDTVFTALKASREFEEMVSKIK